MAYLRKLIRRHFGKPLPGTLLMPLPAAEAQRLLAAFDQDTSGEW